MSARKRPMSRLMARMMEAGQPCDGMDPVQPVLCHQHGADPAKTLRGGKAADHRRCPRSSRCLSCRWSSKPRRRQPSPCRVAPPRRSRLRTPSSSPRSDCESDPLRRLTGAGAAVSAASNASVRPRSLRCQHTSCARSLLAAALLPAWTAAATLSLDQAIDLAVQRSEAAAPLVRVLTSAAEMARAAGQQPDPMLTRRHRQPSRHGPGALQHDRRVDDDEAHRHRAGMGVVREASRPRGRRSAPWSAASRSWRASLRPKPACRPRWPTSTPTTPARRSSSPRSASMHAHEELEAGKGRLATTSRQQRRGAGADQLRSAWPRTSPAMSASSRALRRWRCSAGWAWRPTN